MVKNIVVGVMHVRQERKDSRNQGWMTLPNMTKSLDAINGYFDLLGGTNIQDDTYSRVINFSQELKAKREYDKFTTFDTKVSEMIVINGLKIFSFCEHHLMPFFGYCSIGYIPDNKMLGLSKFQRLVDKCSSKPHTQENLTDEIAHELRLVLETKGDQRSGPLGIGVAMTCTHTCMFGRGINTSTITVNSQVLKGKISQSDARNEFLMRIKSNENLHC